MAALLFLVVTSPSFAAIGVYKCTATGCVPTVISYMLNTNADDTSGDWSVRIQVVPRGGGQPVKTWTFLYPQQQTLRGMRQGAVTWDGTDDSGQFVPPGNYDAVITARAAPVTGNDLVPLWEAPDLGGKWMDAAVNTNPGSPYHGYVYAVNYGTKQVYMYDPAGGFVKTFPTRPSDNYYGSAPWGIAVADDDKVYVISHSRYYVVEFGPDGTGMSPSIVIESWKNPRFFSVTGAGESFKIACTYWSPGQPPTQTAFLAQSGSQPPATPFNSFAVPLWCLMEPEFDRTDTGAIHVPAYGDAGSNWGGALVKMSFDDASIIAQNDRIHRGTGLATSPDGNHLYVSRFVSSTPRSPGDPFSDDDDTAIYRIPADAAYATADPVTGVGVEKLGIANTIGPHRALTLDADGFGNIAAAAGNANFYSNATQIGLYAPPDNGSVAACTVQIVCPPDPPPSGECINCPVPVSSCEPGAAATIRIRACDEAGHQDICGCFLDMTAFGLGALVPMNRVSADGDCAVYELAFTVPASMSVADHTVPVVLRDCHYPLVPDSSCEATIRVTGGWISGRVVAASCDWPVDGATVTATDAQNDSFTTRTGAEGSYLLSVAPGDYTVEVRHDGYQPPDASAEQVTVACSETAAGVDRVLLPLDVRECVDISYGSALPESGDRVCVRGVVGVSSHLEGEQCGLDGYYYIFDTVHGALYGCRVMDFPGQHALRAGDVVTVDGAWAVDMGGLQGRIVPTRTPCVEPAGMQRPQPVLFYHSMINYTSGLLARVSGVCASVEGSRFTMLAPSGPSDPTSVPVTVVVDTPASMCIAMPRASDFVDFTGVLAAIDPCDPGMVLFADPGRSPVAPVLHSLGEANAVGDGCAAVLDLAADPAIVTWLDPNTPETPRIWLESAGRSSGLKVNPGGRCQLSDLHPGDRVVRLTGRMVTPAWGEREFVLLQSPIFEPGSAADIPDFLCAAHRSLAASGPDTTGLLMRITGMTCGYGFGEHFEWFFVDDGSGLPGADECRGVKVVRRIASSDPLVPFPREDGTWVTVEGISSSIDTGSQRIRLLRLRYDPAHLISDQVIVYRVE